MQAATLPITLPRWEKPAYYVVIGLGALIVLGFSIAYELLPVFGIVEEKFSGGER